MDENALWWTDLSDSQFRLSDEANRFTVVGCNSLAYMQSVNTGMEYMTGCMATCPGAGRLENGSCSGMGCYQAAIPRGINTYGVQFDDRFNTSRITGFSRCSYTVLMEAAAFDFRTTYVTGADFVESTGGKVPLVDWVVGKETCREAVRNATAYMCASSNSECVDSRNGPGYLCNCSTGYEGNPYIPHGCQEVPRVISGRPLICVLTNARTRSTRALFLEPVSTLLEDSSDLALARQQATITMAHARLRNLNSEYAWPCISIGVVVVLVLAMSGSYMVHQKRSLATVKRRYLKQHGGLLLFEEMKSKQGLSFTLFTKEELEEATNNFDERNVLGKGGNGTVYKGVLKDEIGRDKEVQAGQREAGESSGRRCSSYLL